MIRIVICGIAGRMGGTLAALIDAAPDLNLAGGIDREHLTGADARRYGCDRIATPDQSASLLQEADVVLDFSAPDALRSLLSAGADALAGRALVVGTTGMDADLENALNDAATRAAVLVAANFSIGVNLLLGLTERAARVLPAAEYDAEIVEAHHRAKEDAPSGTALALAQALARGRGVALERVRRDGRSGAVGARPEGEIGLHAVRGGGVVGDHEVLFLGARERIVLKHVAMDRALFADGALLAARWLAGREPGRYAMTQVLGL